MQAEERCQRAAELGPRNDGVDETVVLEIFSRLKVIGQFLTQRLFNHPTTGKPNQGLRLSQNQITQHRKACGYATRGGVGEQR